MATKIKITMKGGDLDLLNQMWWYMPEAISIEARCMMSVGQELQSKLKKKSVDIEVYDKKNKLITLSLTYHHAYFLWKIIGIAGKPSGIYESAIIQRLSYELEEQLS